MHFAAGATLTAGQMNDVAHSGIQLIDDRELETNTSVVSFSSIPQEFQNLWLVCNGGITGTSRRDINIRMNGDDGTDSYSLWRTARVGDGTFEEAVFMDNNAAIVGRWPNGTTAGTTSTMLYAYNRTDREKIIDGTHSAINGDTSADISVGQIVAIWRSTAAITSIDIYQPVGEDLLPGSIFQLYGLGFGGTG